MLENKIRMTRKVLLTGLSAAVVILGATGCGKVPPSQYCCEAKRCSQENSLPICDGEGDDCYCRSPNCCEILDCSGTNIYCVNGYGGTCMCQKESDR